MPKKTDYAGLVSTPYMYIYYEVQQWVSLVPRPFQVFSVKCRKHVMLKSYRPRDKAIRSHDGITINFMGPMQSW